MSTKHIIINRKSLITKTRGGNAMSMPNIPNIKPDICVTREDAINLLLVSIALEEIGLSNLIEAEAKKIRVVLQEDDYTEPSIKDIKEVNKIVNETVKNIIKLQMLLQFKLENVLEIKCKDTCSKTCSTTTCSSSTTTSTPPWTWFNTDF